MDDKESRLKFLQDKYRRLYKHSGYARTGGFFRTERRKQLLNISGRSGRGRSITNFWYDVRQAVKSALIDLQLFIETARDKDVDDVLNRESLEDIAKELLYSNEENSTKARVAHLFVEVGFTYLRDSSKYLTEKQKGEVNDAIALSQQLTILQLPNEERSSFFYSGGRT